MSCTQQIETRFQSKGYRLTPQRMAILQALQHSGGHLTPADVYELAHPLVAGLTEATVYRTLEFLVEHHLAQAVPLGNGKLAYEAAGHPHHHLVCQHCGCEVELELQELAGMHEQIEHATGFRLNIVPISFYGVCPKCQE